MTLFYPDVSGYDAGISLAGVSAVVVKATEGTTYTNPDYSRVAADATRRGIPWAAYHFVRHGNGAGQADHFHQVAGNASCMLDVETATDGTRATVQDALDFSSRLKSLGGRVVLVYLPRWYWGQIGSPDLTPLARAGMALVSSNYTTYSDTGPGWAPYGGVTPTVWQYTDAHQLNGYAVDYNAYRGTVDQFRALLQGDNEMIDYTQVVPDGPARQGLPTRTIGQWIGDVWAQTFGLGDKLTAEIGEVKTALGQAQPVTLSDADRQALTAAMLAAVPTAADVAAHLDYNQLAAAIAQHVKIQ